jgi:hypothetical protein
MLSSAGSEQLRAYAMRVLSDLRIARDELNAGGEAALERIFPPEDGGLAARAIVIAPGVPDTTSGASSAHDAVAAQRRRLLEAGADAVDAIDRDGPDAPLAEELESGLEAIVTLVARPAILMHDGRFGDVLPPWGEWLSLYRDDIGEASRRVGRVEVAGIPQLSYGGTGFLVGDDVVMTNCHVALHFATTADARTWALSFPSSVAFLDDPDADRPVDRLPGVRVCEVIGIHECLDLALLRVDPAPGLEPLTVSSRPPDELDGRRVYLLGYPAPDWRNDQAAQRGIFGNRYRVKRLQPGAVMPAPEAIPADPSPCAARMTRKDMVFHDASTLGGNSGSAVIDLDTNQVIGLHFGGRYLQYNQAVALWRLTEDPLLVGAGVKFD